MDKVKEFIQYLSLPYIVAISGIYNFAYWSQFDINIFLYLELLDIVKGFIYPLVKSIYIIIIYFVISFIAIPKISINLDEVIYDKNNETHNQTKHILILLIILLAVNSVLSLILSNFLVLEGIYLIFGAIIITYLIRFFNLGYSIIPDLRMRIFIFMFMIITFISAFIIGTNTSREIFDNEYYDYTYNNFDFHIQQNKPLFKYKYLGSAGDFYFFISMNNKVKYIINKDELKNFRLLRFEKEPSLLQMINTARLNTKKGD